MSGKRTPHDRIFDELKNDVAEAMDGYAGEAEDFVGSPIEGYFYVALATACDFGFNEVRAILRIEDDAALRETKEDAHYRPYILLQSQKQVAGRRVDFLIHYYHWRDGRWKEIVVECDGHAYHERTKEQASKDRSFDRLVQRGGGERAVLRFTGSELWNSPWGCANEVIGIYQRGLG